MATQPDLKSSPIVLSSYCGLNRPHPLHESTDSLSDGRPVVRRCDGLPDAFETTTEFGISGEVVTLSLRPKPVRAGDEPLAEVKFTAEDLGKFIDAARWAQQVAETQTKIERLHGARLGRLAGLPVLRGHSPECPKPPRRQRDVFQQPPLGSAAGPRAATRSEASNAEP